MPVGLVIPAIDLDVGLTTLGLNTDGTVQVPSNPSEPGWFDLGPTPGQRGSAVILGHVDSYEGPAVFYLLSALTPGDQIAVRLRNGSVAHFRVSSMATYANADFPNDRVYTSHGYAGLQLVTCGGGFDSVAGHYLGNLVVYTRLVDITASNAGRR
ncbi:MAG: class F sortase [Nocardioidaceae bacterium]